MSNAARFVSAIAAISIALSAQPIAADLEQDDPFSHKTTVVNATAEQQAQVDWALGQFEAAGLPIPAITITFHNDSRGCHGYLGYYDPTPKTLDMCNWGQHYKITPTSTLLHELAHAWSFEHMTAEDRHDFTEHRGLDNWHHEGPWWHMGQEQAAEIIAWAVGGDDFVSVYLSEDCSDLSAAYALMTSGSGPSC